MIKRVNSLKEKKYRNRYGEFLAEGYKQIREAIGAGMEITGLFYSPKYEGELKLHPCAVAVSEEVFCKLSEEVNPQGVLAVLKIPREICEPPEGNALLLDGVSDPGNLGAILRTANGAGYRDVYLRNCTDPYSPKCVRAAMSGLFFIRLHTVTDEGWGEAFDRIPLICADMSGENLYEFTAPERFCLVIGNEANGVSKEVRARCEYTVKIPMRETCESLNAGVSAGIMMYHLKFNHRR